MFNEKKADIAFREDRERFFKEADKYNLPYFAGSISESQKKELSIAVQCWRDMTTLKGYPDIDFPLEVPDFMKVKLFSCHKKGAEKANVKDSDFVEVKDV